MRCTAVFLLALILAGSLHAVDWPKDYVVADDTQSPDGRYAILVPPLDDASGGNLDDSVNYFVDVKAHRVLGQIAGVNYFQHQNHASLFVSWSADSSFCVADYDGRFGFNFILLLRPREKDFTQTEIGGHIQSALDAVIAKEEHIAEKDAGGEASADFRINPDHKILFRVTATTNPKELDDVRTACAFFAGTYDPPTGRWLAEAARPIDMTMFNRLSSSLFTLDFDSTTYSDPQSEADSYDGTLNQIYAALRFLLPKAEFAKVKASQIAWLKERDAIPTLPAKNLLVKARIKALQEMLW